MTHCPLFCFPPYIKRLCSSFGNTLAHFTGDAGASLYMWPSSQDLLQHTEGISFCTTRHSTLTGNQCVDKVIFCLHSQLTYVKTQTTPNKIQ